MRKFASRRLVSSILSDAQAPYHPRTPIRNKVLFLARRGLRRDEYGEEVVFELYTFQSSSYRGWQGVERRTCNVKRADAPAEQ